MPLRSWLESLRSASFRRRRRGAKQTNPPRRRLLGFAPRFEPLEERRLLAVWSQQDHVVGFPDPVSPQDGAQYGHAVAVDGDWMVVGARLDDVNGLADAGAAYIYRRNDNGTAADLSDDFWSAEARLTASDAAASDLFGHSVSISGETVVVGSVSDDVASTANSGSAYIFTRSGTAWSQQQKLTADDAAASDEFGYSVSISGETVIVGSRLDDVGSMVNSGSAYIFNRSGSVWSQQRKLTAHDAAAFDLFGFSVSISGETVVVGSYLDDGASTTDSGSAYIFNRSGTSWSQLQKLSAGDAASDDQFGYSVSISGETLVVGSLLDDVGSTVNSGSAYIFTRSGTVWSQQQRLSAGDAAQSDLFGHSVSISGETAVVGSLFGDVASTADSGSAYIFTRNGTAWSQQQKLSADGAASKDQFGVSVSISGETVVVGSLLDDVLHGATNVSNAGSAYIFERTPVVLHWQGDVSDRWSDPANWLEGIAPSNGDALVFDTNTAGFLKGFSKNDIIGLNVQDLQVIDDSASDFTIHGQAISLNAGLSDGGAANNTTIAFSSIILKSAQTFTHNSGNLNIASAINTNGQVLTFSGDSSSGTSVNGAISGAGSLTKTGSSILQLAGANTYDGVTTVSGGQLAVRQGSSLGNLTSGTVVNPGASLLFFDNVTSIEPLTVSGEGQFNGGAILGGNATVLKGAITLASDTKFSNTNTGSTFTIAGAISDAGAGFGITTSFTQTGQTMVLFGANSYTGATTTANAGTLLVNGQLNGPASIVNGGTLGGSGVINGPVSIQDGATLAPGNSIGMLQTGHITFASNARFAVEIEGSGDALDRLAAGGYTLNGARLDIDLSPTAALRPGDELLIVEWYDGPGDGFFTDSTGNLLTEGEVFEVDGTFFRISYAPFADEKDVLLTIVVPAPTLQLTAGGPISFASAANYSSGASPLGIAVGDFNGDSANDFVVVNENSNDFAVLLNRGDGTFSNHSWPALRAHGTSAAAGDFNGDARLDLAVTTYEGLSIFLGNGNGTFQSSVDYAAGSLPVHVVASDLNGDHNIDLVVVNQFSSNVSVFLNNGNGTFARDVRYGVGVDTSPLSVAVADFDGDSRPDLAVANQTINTVSVLLNHGNGTFQPAQSVPANSNPASVAAGDFNADGKQDLAVANFSSGQVSVLLGNGKGTFQTPITYTIDARSRSVIVSDFNNDGRLDIAAGTLGTQGVSVLTGVGDGTFQASLNFSTSARPITIAAGDMNGDGKVDLVSANYNSGNASVLLNQTAGLTITEGGTVTIAGRISNLDASDAHRVTINWGDDSPETVIDLAAGMLDIPATSHRYADDNAADAYPIRVVVADDDRDTASATLTATVTNHSPTALDDFFTVTEDSGISLIHVLANDHDPAGAFDPLTIILITNATHGLVSIVADGTLLSYQTAPDFSGTDSFSYIIIDGDGGMSTATVTIIVDPVNDLPDAREDAYIIGEDGVLSVLPNGVLANDGDIDGDPLIVAGFYSASHGTVSIFSSGGFHYTPDPDFHGIDTFIYEIQDGHGPFSRDYATVTIEVTPVNDAPQVSGGFLGSGFQEGDAVTRIIGIVDPDLADTFTVIVNWDDPHAPADSRFAVGRFSSLREGDQLASSSDDAVLRVIAVDAARGEASFTVTHRFGDNRPGTNDLFTTVVTVMDGGGIGTNRTSTFVTNVAPTAADDLATVAEDSGATTIDVLANDTDPARTFDPLTITTATHGTHGVVTVAVDGKSLRYMPDADFFGTDTFSYTISDGDGGTSTATVTIVVDPVNDLPDVRDDAYTTAEDGVLFVPPNGVLANDGDIDGDPLIVAGYYFASHGTVSIWSGGEFRYTPDPDFHGIDTFIYEIQDGHGPFSRDYATVTITVTPVNDAPLAVDDTVSTDEDVTLVLTQVALTGNDTDIDNTNTQLSVIAVSVATGGSVVLNADGTIRFAPEPNFHGTAGFDYIVSDGSLTDTGHVTVIVNAVNDAPIGADDAFITSEDTAVSGNVLLNDFDPDGDPVRVNGYYAAGHGTVAIFATGNFTYTPDPNFYGTDSFIYELGDGHLLPDPLYWTSRDYRTVTITVTPVNDAPLAVDDTVSMFEDMSLRLNPAALTGNDLDIDSSQLAVTSVSAATGGFVNINSDGTITFIPDRDFNGLASFDYTVSDGDLEDVAHVTVAVLAVNDAPTATVTLDSFAPRTNDVLTATATAADVEGDLVTLKYVWRVDGIVRQTTTTTALTNTFDLSHPGNGNKGQRITVEVTPNDGVAEGMLVAATTTVVNSAPRALISLNTTTPGKHDIVQARVTPLDPDGDSLVVTYVWRINGVVVQTLTTSALTSTLDLKAFKVKKDDRITVEATPFDGSIDGPLVSAAAVVNKGGK